MSTIKFNNIGSNFWITPKKLHRIWSKNGVQFSRTPIPKELITVSHWGHGPSMGNQAFLYLGKGFNGGLGPRKTDLQSAWRVSKGQGNQGGCETGIFTPG